MARWRVSFSPGSQQKYYTLFPSFPQLLFDKALYFYYYIICKSSPIKEETDFMNLAKYLDIAPEVKSALEN